MTPCVHAQHLHPSLRTKSPPPVLCAPPPPPRRAIMGDPCMDFDGLLKFCVELGGR